MIFGENLMIKTIMLVECNVCFFTALESDEALPDI